MKKKKEKQGLKLNWKPVNWLNWKLGLKTGEFLECGEFGPVCTIRRDMWHFWVVFPSAQERVLCDAFPMDSSIMPICARQ